MVAVAPGPSLLPAPRLPLLADTPISAPWKEVEVGAGQGRQLHRLAAIDGANLSVLLVGARSPRSTCPPALASVCRGGRQAKKGER